MPTPNDKFREARERTPSQADPTECLTRQELAEEANTWLWEHHSKEFVLTGGYIGKLEQGVIRWPTALYREAFRAILEVPTDSELGFVNVRARRAAVKLGKVKRRNLFKTTTVGVGALALGESMLTLLESDEPTPIPDRVGATDIEHIRTITQELRSWRRAYGGGVVRDAARGQLRWSAGLLKATCPDQLRPDLFSAVGMLAQVAGYAAWDAGAHEQARRALRFALACAEDEEAQDWHLRADVLDTMALQAVRAGQPDDALTLADQGLIRADRLTATVQAMLHATRSRALAKMRRVQEALSAVGTADEHFAHATPGNEPPFMAYYTTAYLAGNTGQALFDLAILGHHPERASERLTTAVAENTTDRAREQAIFLAKLASLTMATGDPLQAAALGHQALDVASSIRSRRVAEELRELSRYAAAHQDLEEVAHLRQRIGTLLLPTDSP